MGKRPLVRLAAAAAGGLLTLAFAAPAWAQTDVPLNQSNVFANDPEFDKGFGECSEVPQQDPNEDVWVFVWPGNVDKEQVLSLELNFDSDGDGTADTTLTLTDATGTSDQGTAKYWVTTPAGWKLIDGTSTVSIQEPNPAHFNLTHSCAGEPGDETTPPGDETTPPGDETTPPGDETTPPGKDEKPGLPATGMSLGGLLILSGGLLAAGIALVAVRRRRSLSDLLDS